LSTAAASTRHYGRSSTLTSTTTLCCISTSQYNRRLRDLVELISIVQQRLARWLDSGGVRWSDGTLISVATYPGCAQRSESVGFARFGHAKSQHRFVYASGSCC
jgi:hypothetical protein